MTFITADVERWFQALRDIECSLLLGRHGWGRW